MGRMKLGRTPSLPVFSSASREVGSEYGNNGNPWCVDDLAGTGQVIIGDNTRENTSGRAGIGGAGLPALVSLDRMLPSGNSAET